MTYATLMVHLELGSPNTRLLEITAFIVERFQASVVGIAGAEPMQMTYGGDSYMSGELFVEERKVIDEDMAAAEAAFRKAFHGRGDRASWRSAVDFSPVSLYLAKEARCADLILTTGDQRKASPHRKPQVNAGELALYAGRPILVVPPDIAAFKPRNVMIAWKDSREARRAVVDALPFLVMASRVDVVAVAPDDQLRSTRAHLEDVVTWLNRQGVTAGCRVAEASHDYGAHLSTIADDAFADLVVAGAYGHSRLREWAFGGVTSHLLLESKRCILLSH